MVMTLQSTNVRDQRWAVILAGGDGKRLLPLTRIISGDDRPKQFCPIDGETLLERTRKRIAGTISPRQTLLLLTADHESFYKSQIKDVPESLRVVQPYNRGTAPAIIYALLRLRRINSRMTVAFFPSDHHFSNDSAFLDSVEHAFETVESQPKLVALLGIAPDNPEADYGWIEPGRPLPGNSGGLRYVRQFWEKPSSSVARSLMRNGCLWNSFVMVGRVEAFLGMVAAALPELLQRFESARLALGTAAEMEAVGKVYKDIAPANFSKEVLAVRPDDLTVLRLENAGWSDLGDPARVRAVLGRQDLRQDLKAKPSRCEDMKEARAGAAVA